MASNSPRRRQLLALTGWNFDISPAEVDERPLPGELPPAYVLRLAESKARGAGALVPAEAVIIAADTTVAATNADGGVDILGKPADAADAEGMLRRLRGHTHQVYTALAVLHPVQSVLLLDWCATQVPMRETSDVEISAYVASGNPLDKAGAYAIQHAGFHPVESLAGCYANVVGLPLCHLTRTLGKLGITPLNDVPHTCQSALEYQCPIYQHVLDFDI